MKNMRKILAAVLAVVMVLAMLPAAFAADTTYTLDIATLEDVAQGSKADGDVLVGDYFTIVFSAKTRIESNSKDFEDGFEAGKRLNFGGNTSIADQKNAVKFTTSGAATIKVWWVSGGDGREVAIHDEAGEVLVQSNFGSVKNSLYISELKVEAAGTYYIGNVGGNNNYYKLEATEAAAPGADVPGTDDPVDPEPDVPGTDDPVDPAPDAPDTDDPVDPNPDAPIAPAPGVTYIVKPGDTLGKIALAHYGIVAKYQAIFEANRHILKNPNTIYVGQVLTLPGENLLAPAEGETLYTIQPGDTLGKIALAHYGSMAAYKTIYERNSTHLASPSLIYAGQVIVLPAK